MRKYLSNVRKIAGAQLHRLPKNGHPKSVADGQTYGVDLFAKAMQVTKVLHWLCDLGLKGQDQK